MRLTEIGFENAMLQRRAGLCASSARAARSVAGKGAIYRVTNFNYGLILPGEGMTGVIDTLYDAEPLSAHAARRCRRRSARCRPPTTGSTFTRSASRATARPTTPPPSRRRSTRIACCTFPSGHYIVRDTITLKPDTVLIGLHPTLTQLDLPDATPGLSGRRRAAAR